MSNLLNIKDQNGNWIPIPVVTNGIKSITQNQDYTLTITLNDGTAYTTTSIKGEDGQDYVLTESDKQEIAGLVDVPVEDVQLNGTSVVSNGVANISIPEPDPEGMVVKTTLVSGNQYTIDSTYDTIKATLSSGANVIVMAQDVPQPYVGNVQMDGVWYLAFGVSTTYNNYATLVGFLIPEIYQNIAVWVDQSVHIPVLDDSDVDANVVWSSNKIIDELSQKIDDVQINGTSAVTNGVANIPVATNDNLGVVRTNSTYGVYATNGTLAINNASESDIKSGTNSAKPLTPNREHMSTFYGLAKAAGDTTQSSSSNTVGTYTSEAKIAIKQMLDVKDDYDSLVVEVSGTDPVITGKPSYRYNCGELYTLTVTPPASGTMDIIFTSGTTPTVLSLPNTVKMPDWWAGIETNTTYEMCITDGTYCGVMSWAT